MNIKVNFKESLFQFAVCAIFFSAIFWMRDTVDFVGWSVTEAAIIACAVRWFWKNGTIALPQNKIFISILILIFYAALGLIWTVNFHATLTGLYKLCAIVLMLILFLNEIEKWWNAICYVAVGFSLLGAALILILPGHWLYWINHPNLFGGFLALGGILCSELFFTAQGGKRLIFFFLNLLIVAALLSIGSLGPAIAWLTGIVWQLLRYKKKILLLILLMMAALAAILTHSEIKIFERKLADPYSTERIEIWKDAASYFSHHPWLGTGLGTFRDYYPEYKKIPSFRNTPYAHDEPLNVLCEFGIAGGAILAWIGLLVLTGKKQLQKDWGVWGAVLCGALIHSLFDFNLRYPPILILAIFSTGSVFTKREIEIKNKTLPATALLFAGTLFILPGAADFLFRVSYPDPVKRRRAAIIASELDPFNALYHFETKRMRDLMIAIDLEPRNVWYRREAARFWINAWNQSRDENNFNLATEQYGEILKLAPNVVEFQLEFKNLKAQGPHEPHTHR